MDLSNRYINNTFTHQELLKVLLILKSFNVYVATRGFKDVNMWGTILYLTPYKDKYVSHLEHNSVFYVPYSHYTELTMEELLQYDSR